MNISESINAKFIRYRHLLKHFVLYRIIFRKWQIPAKKMRGKFKGKTCFIFATGPSVNQMDLSKVDEFVKAGAKIFGVNSYISSDLADRFPPDFVVLSDPEHLNHEIASPKFHKEIRRDQEIISKKEGFLFCVPHNWYKQIQMHPFFQKKDCFYFNNAENYYGSPNGCNVLRPRYFVSMTAYATINIACHLGFSEIYLFGFDEDYFQVTEMDIHNHVIWRDRHYYPEDAERIGRNMSLQCGLTFKQMLINGVRSVISQEKLNQDAKNIGISVLNCNPGSFVTGFAKTDQFLKKKS